MGINTWMTIQNVPADKVATVLNDLERHGGTRMQVVYQSRSILGAEAWFMIVYFQE